MRRTLYTEDHEAFRKTARTYFERECVPHREEWEAAGVVDRAAWRAAGEAGLIGWAAPPEYGGLGVRDFRYNAVVSEEMAATGATGVGLPLANDVLVPYLVDLTDDAQKARWLPGFVRGELVAALAMSEPGAGSDVRAIVTTARREGDEYVIDGTKTFISNGVLADLVVVACKTDPAAGHKGISLVVVEDGTPGFSRGRHLDKIGQRAFDTAELVFDGVRVPVANRLGPENRGFYLMMANLPSERLGIAVAAIASAWRALTTTRRYATDREAFGQPIGSFQVNRHALAEMRTELDVAQVYLDRCVQAVVDGELTAVEAAEAKWWATELAWRVIDRCLQLHGGYGYIREYEIARLFEDARVQRLYGGTTEIMKDIIGRDMGF